LVIVIRSRHAVGGVDPVLKHPLLEGEALRLVWNWKDANDLRFLSPRASRDLAERIERVMLEERSEANQP
jgi:hypothetical protein